MERYMERWRAENRVRIMWLNARRRAIKNGVPFTITVQDIEKVWPADNRCPIFGLAFKVNKKRGPSPDSATLDRVLPELGYVPGNIAIISHKANYIKSDASINEVRRVADWMESRKPLE